MSASYTPGPWQAKGDYTVSDAVTIIANVDGESFSDGATTHTYDFIATCEDEYGERLPNAQANARLIAAAPDLYAALEHVLTSALSLPRFASAEGWAALAKARGDQVSA
jgi:hypothetical protein